MRDRRGLAATTIAHSLPVVQALLGTVGDDPAGLDAAGVRRFVLEYIRQHAPASAGCVTTIVRCFLRWLVAHGSVRDGPRRGRSRRCPRGGWPRSPATSRMPMWSASSRRAIVPAPWRGAIAPCCCCSLAWACARATSSGSGSATSSGSRDASASPARDGARRGCRFLRTSGDAILGYLEAERPAAATDHVFLTARTPIRPIGSSGLRDVVCSRDRARRRSGSVPGDPHPAPLARDPAAPRRRDARRDRRRLAPPRRQHDGALRQGGRRPAPTGRAALARRGGVAMLRPSIDAYLALRRAVGFRLKTEEHLLHDFARWAVRSRRHARPDADGHGMGGDGALDSGSGSDGSGPSPASRATRGPRIPVTRCRRSSCSVAGTCVPDPTSTRRTSCGRLLDAASRLPAIWPLRPQVFTTLFGLLGVERRAGVRGARRCDSVTSRATAS